MIEINEFLEKVKDEYGEDSVVRNENLLDNGVISTGSLSLDVSLGIGGIPRGMFSEIVGPESSGKTTLALHVAKEAMKQDLNVLYLDAERSLDYRYIRAIIGEFDESKLIILSPETAEDFFKVAEDGINSKSFGLIILDSLGALAPEGESEKDFDKNSVALLPRLLSKFLRRNSFKVKASNMSFIFLNQVRDKIGSFMGGYESPGGHALKHFEAIKIKLTKGIKLEKGTKENKEAVGIISNFTVVKNKVAPPFRSGTIPIIFGKGVDYYRDVLEIARRLGVVRTAGSYYKFEDENIGQGVAKAKQRLKEDEKLLDKIKEMCYTIISPKLEKEIETDET